MLSFLLLRSRQRRRDIPASFDPVSKGLFAEAGGFAPSDQRLRLTVKCQESVSAEISFLLGLSRPSTIVRFIIAIVVYAINGMGLRRTWTHIGNEVRERQPSVAYGDASACITLKKRVATPLDHAAPQAVFGMFGYSGFSHHVSILGGDVLVRGWRSLITNVGLVFHYGPYLAVSQ